MVGPIRFDGLSSGIDYTAIIEKLLSIQKRPIVDLQNRISRTSERKTALLQINASLLAFKGVADNFARPSFFNMTKASSSNENILKASGSQVGSLGAFQFVAKRLATSQQLLSNGFADSTTTAVTSVDSTLRIEVGGGFLERKTSTAVLNALAGFDRGSIKITNSLGAVSVINLEAAVTVKDILDTINNTPTVGVTASVTADRIVVRDTAGGPITIENFGADTTATGLGIAGTAPGGTIFGSDINTLASTTSLRFLNDGLGVRRNSDGAPDFTITDTDGVPITVDIKAADDTIEKVRDRIISSATAAASSLTAAISADGRSLVLNDAAGVGGILVSAAADSFAAVDLGFGTRDVASAAFVQVSAESSTTGAPSATGNRLYGNRLVASLNSTLRTLLNGGQTNTTAAVAPTAAAGIGATTISVASVDAFSVGDRINIVEAGVRQVRRITALSASAGTLTIDAGLTSAITAAASIFDLQGVGDGAVTLTDRSGASLTVDLSARIARTVSSSTTTSVTFAAAADLQGFAVGNKIRVLSGGVMETRTVSAISGLTVTFDQAVSAAPPVASTVYAVNESLGDIVNQINERATAAGVDIRVSIDPESNGLLVTDFSGGTGALTVTGAAATDLGIAGSISANTINGTDLDPQWLGEQTLLSKLNAGAGVAPGKFRVIDSNGIQFDVDLNQPDDVNLAEVIKDANGAAAAALSDARFRVNNTGDGLLISEAVAGGGVLKVQELNGGRTARDLNILGAAPTSTPSTLNGSFEYSITIKAGSKLADVATAINDRQLGVQASVINDGSPVNPFKITLLSKKSGEAGRLVVDSDVSGLSFATSAPAQDALLLYGSNGGPTDPIPISSSTNTITGVIPGLTLDLKSASDAPVTVTVSKDVDNIVKQGQAFVEKYNAVIQKIREFTFFDPKTFESGPLFSDPAVRRIRQDLASLITSPVIGVTPGDINSLSAVGFKVTSEGGLTLDSSKLQSQLETNFDDVVSLFTLQSKLKFETPLKDLNNGSGITSFPGDDFEVRTRSATKKLNIDVAPNDTISAVLSKINNHPSNGGAITAAISADGFSLQLTDNTAAPTRAVEGVPTTTTFVETDLDIEPLADDFLNGATITFTSGANAGEVRKVLDWNTVSNTITLDSALSVAPAVGDTYVLQRELEVAKLNGSPNAAELKLEKKMDLGQNLLKGGILNLKLDPGAGSRLSDRMDEITRSGDGLISTRTGSLDDTIEGYNKSIDRIDTRIEKLEARLVREFARLETIIAQSQSTLSRLQSSLLAFVGTLGNKK